MCQHILTDDGAKVLDFGIAASAWPIGFGRGDVLLGTRHISRRNGSGRLNPLCAAAISTGWMVWYQIMAGEMPWTRGGRRRAVQSHLSTCPPRYRRSTGCPSGCASLHGLSGQESADRPTSRQLAAEARPLPRRTARAALRHEPIVRAVRRHMAQQGVSASPSAARRPGRGDAAEWLGLPTSPATQAIAARRKSLRHRPRRRRSPPTPTPSEPGSPEPVVRPPARATTARRAPRPPASPARGRRHGAGHLHTGPKLRWSR